MRARSWWKLAGLAAVVGVTASGVVIARAERRRRAYTPDEVRERLHTRYRAVADEPAEAPSPRP